MQCPEVDIAFLVWGRRSIKAPMQEFTAFVVFIIQKTSTLQASVQHFGALEVQRHLSFCCDFGAIGVNKKMVTIVCDPRNVAVWAPPQESSAERYLYGWMGRWADECTDGWGKLLWGCWPVGWPAIFGSAGWPALGVLGWLAGRLCGCWSGREGAGRARAGQDQPTATVSFWPGLGGEKSDQLANSSRREKFAK
jgi:hypothetical protein